MVFQYGVGEVGFSEIMGGVFFSILRSWSERVFACVFGACVFGDDSFRFFGALCLSSIEFLICLSFFGKVLRFKNVVNEKFVYQ